MHLYLVHTGFYDPDLGDGAYECHSNFFVIADSFQAARTKAKALPEFQKKRMHIDGLQKVEVVEGYRITPVPTELAADQTRIETLRHRDLASSGQT